MGKCKKIHYNLAKLSAETMSISHKTLDNVCYQMDSSLARDMDNWK